MAFQFESIRRLIIKAEAQGVDSTTGSLNKLSDAQRRVAETGQSVATVTDTSSKKQLSAQSSYDRLNRSLDENVRAQSNISRATRDLDRAFSQGIINQQQYDKNLAQIHAKYDIATQKSSAYAQSLSYMQTQYLLVAGAAASWAIAYDKVAGAALRLADTAGKLKDFSETTGFTTDQLQAFDKAGAQVGVSSESITKALEKFSVSMDDVKKSTGGVYDAVHEIDPVLAGQLARVKSVSQAWDILATASRKADLEQRNALSKAAFGRGGIELTRLQGASADAGGVAGLVAQLNALDILSQKQIDRWDTLGDTINERMKAAKQNIASIFTEAVLGDMDTFSNSFLEISRTMKEFSLGQDFKDFMEWIKSPNGAALLGGLAGAWIGAIGGPVGMVAGGAIGAGVGAARGLQRRDRLEADARNGVMPPPHPDNYVPPGGRGEMDSVTEAFAANREAAFRSYSEMTKWASAISAALTPAEKYKLELLRINAALAKNDINAAQASRGNAAAGRSYMNAIGATAIEAQTDALRVQMHTMGMTARAAVEYSVVEEKRLEGIRNGKPLSEAELAILREKASLLGRVTEQNLKQSINRNIAFDRATMFLSQEDVAIAQQLKGLYPDVASSLGSVEAAAIRVNQSMRFLGDTFSNAFVQFGQNLRQGMSAWDAFKQAGVNALGSIADKLIKMAADNLLMAAFGGSSSAGGIGGLLAGLFGGGGSGGPISTFGAAGANFPVPTFGAANGGSFGPGWGMVGEEGPELINVGSGGVTVYSNPQSAAMMGGRMPGFASGGSLNAIGQVIRPANDNNAGAGTIKVDANDNRVITITGGDAAAVAQLKAMFAKDKQERPAQIIMAVREAQATRNLR